MGDDITDNESLSEEPLSVESSDYKLCGDCQNSFLRRHLNDDGLCRECEA